MQKELKDIKKDDGSKYLSVGSDLLSNQSKIKEAPKNAPLSVFNNQEVSENIIVKANGLVRETLACFQMLSKILNFPIRKDSLEKILRDYDSRGAKIDLQLIGELLSNLGLHVSSGAIPT